LGATTFFGEGPDFTVDSTKPVTVVTQFLTSDGTDQGDLVEIRRIYVQDGKVIHNSDAPLIEGSYDSITEEYCSAVKTAFGDADDFKKKRGLVSMGEAMDRGMVLVMSLWDDKEARMLWLDSTTGDNDTEREKLGAKRGDCPLTGGDPMALRSSVPDSYVTYKNIMYGEIDSTYTAGAAAKPAAAAANDDGFAAAMDAWKSGPPLPGQSSQPGADEQTPAASTPAAEPADGAAANDACGGAYAQCGGGTWAGASCCQDGCNCVGDSHYSQCQPPEGAWSCGGGPSATVMQQHNDVTIGPITRTGRMSPTTILALVVLPALVTLLAAAMMMAWSAFWRGYRRRHHRRLVPNLDAPLSEEGVMAEEAGDIALA
jgi:cellulose 1,4-beta-cellobiosidase